MPAAWPCRPSFVGFYDKPILKFERILDTYIGVAPRGFRQFLMAGPLWIKETLWMDHSLRKSLGDYEGEILYAEHHESHAASAFFPSPFREAAILTMDGVGEWATASFGVGRGNDIELMTEMHWPDSLGLLYSAFTYYMGFKVNSGEYKVMGLAPYGEPRYADLILDNLIDVKEYRSGNFDPLVGIDGAVSLLGGFARLNAAWGVNPETGFRFDLLFRAPR